MAAKKSRKTQLCETHGKRIPAVVCGHLVGVKDRVLGFVENSDDPSDLQGWCADCEAKYLEEGDRTEAFKEFHDMAVVCDLCYVRIRKFHSKSDADSN